MKIAIFSDTHFGFSFGSFTKEDSFLQANEVVEKILEMKDVDAVIIAGDIFDSDNPDSSTLAKSLRVLRKLTTKDYAAKVEEVEFRNKKDFSAFPNLPVIAIPATHERKAFGEEDMIEALEIANFVINANNKWIKISKGDEKVNILGLGGIDDSEFKEFLQKEREKIEEEAKSREGFKILLLHQSLKELIPFGNDFASLDELPNGFDLYVCGHIHKKIEARVHGKMFLIPGSTVLTQQKKEEQDKKGFLVFDTNIYSYNFIEINSRPFFYIELNFESASPNDIIEKVKQKIAEVEKISEKPIIKIKVTGTLKEGFKPKDIQLSQLQQDEKALISIDKVLTVKATEIEIEKVRKLIKEGDIKDIGSKMLNEELAKTGFKLDGGTIFEILSRKDERKSKEKAKDENIEEALKFIYEIEKKEIENKKS
jgi:DNA repair exonuclease SbcCD nuclease subunit